MLDLIDAGLPAPARGVFTTRTGGVSADQWQGLNLAVHVDDQWSRVDTNRQLLARELEVELVFAQQVHGAQVRVVDRPHRRGWRGCDGLVTTTPGLGLVMMGADCLPVLLAGTRAGGSGVVGAAHVGRPGLGLGLLHELVRVLREQGAEQLTATLGPGICGRCYEVPEVLADEVERGAPGSRAATRWGTSSVDLLAGATAQLVAEGVPVASVGGCTLEQPERFYSYRRDGLTGRHAGVVWLAP